MSEATAEGLAEALAIVRAKLKARTSKDQRAALETMMLEISAADDAMAVVSGLAEVAATAVETIANIAGLPAEQLLKMIEEGLPGER